MPLWPRRKAVVRLARARRIREELGAALAETVVSLAMFLILAVALEGVVLAGIASNSDSQRRTLGQQLAAEQVESIRVQAYDDVGVIAGNPPGTVLETRTVTSDGLSFTIRTRIQYVNDAIPGSFVTQANYKRVIVWVTQTGTTRELAREETYVAPAVRPIYGGANKAIIHTTIRDLVTSQPIPDATVALVAGPSAPRDDETDASGVAVFPDLTATVATEYYDISATKAGYVVASQDEPPSPSAHFQIAAGQLAEKTLRMFQPATINVVVLNNGTPYTGTATVTVDWSGGSQTFTVSGGLLTITQLAAKPVVPGLQYTMGAQASNLVAAPVTQTVPNSYPTDLTSTFTLDLYPT